MPLHVSLFRRLLVTLFVKKLLLLTVFCLFFIKIIEPHLLATVTVDRTSGVQPNYDLTFTVQLYHSVLSTSPAFRVLLEIAAPHEYLTNVQKLGSPSIGGLTVVAGNQAPSGNPRYYCSYMYTNIVEGIHDCMFSM